jgi:hypothetical protein
MQFNTADDEAGMENRMQDLPGFDAGRDKLRTAKSRLCSTIKRLLRKHSSLPDALSSHRHGGAYMVPNYNNASCFI